MSVCKPKLRNMRKSLLEELRMCRREKIGEVSMEWFAEWMDDLLNILEKIEEQLE